MHRPFPAAGHSPDSFSRVGPAVATTGVPAPTAARATAEREQWQRQLQGLECEARASAALVELMTHVGGADDLQSACCALANHVRDHLGCDRVAVGLRRGPAAPCRIAAISGMPEFDPHSEVPLALEAALNESILRDTLTVFPCRTDQQRQGTLAHRRLCQMTAVGGAVSAPLRSADGRVVGAWLLLGPAELAGDSAGRRFLESASPPLATSLAALAKGEPGRAGRCWRRLRRALPVPSRTLAVGLLAAVAGAMFLPVPYKVSVEGEIQPATRRFLAAPHAGIFAQSLVKPGSVVRRGQVLGRMDGREARLELAGLEAESERASKSHDVSMAEGKLAAAQIDGLEMQRLALKRALLADRTEHLDIKSPIDGIVVSSDLERSEGVPVSVGQVLFEVAPLEQMLVELAIPDEELSHVRPAMEVRICLDSQPGLFRAGKLEKIHPRSVVRERDNVFIGEMPLDNGDATLRPGMKGRAKIAAAPHRLAWILLHRPWEYLVTWWGW
jgi:biotin carboxyl carrier protein